LHYSTSISVKKQQRSGKKEKETNEKGKEAKITKKKMKKFRKFLYCISTYINLHMKVTLNQG
jgi:hypothetical protein